MSYKIVQVPNGSSFWFVNGMWNSSRPFLDSNCKILADGLETISEALDDFRSLAESEVSFRRENFEDFDSATDDSSIVDSFVSSRCFELGRSGIWIHIVRCDEDGEPLEVLKAIA